MEIEPSQPEGFIYKGFNLSFRFLHLHFTFVSQLNPVTTMNEILTYSISSLLGGGLIMTVITHFLTKKKYVQEVKLSQAEAQGKELDNIDKAAEIWRKLNEHLKDEFNQEVDRLNKRYDQTVADLNKSMAELKNELAETKKQLKETLERLKQSDIKNAELTKQLKLYNQNLLSHEATAKG